MNFVTYKENETVDNNANYFLMEISSKDSDINNFSELEIYINNALVIDQIKKEDVNFPLFCFENGNVQSVDDLNLNNLKKFSHDCCNKYILVSLQKAQNTSTNYLKNKSFNDWHNSDTPVTLKFVNGTEKKYCGKILKIFHKHYQPTISE